jgi:hypothetical protein
VIILAAEIIEIATILKIISEIPEIVGKLKLGLHGRGNVNNLKRKLKKFGILGHSIKDYIDLLGYSSDINNKTDVIIKTYIPVVKIENRLVAK